MTSLVSAGEGILLVVAPAGSGKTTLLTQLGAVTGGPVIWYRADRSHARSDVFLQRLQESFAASLPAVRTEWVSPGDAAAALRSGLGPRPVLAIDDFHVLEASPAEETLERLVEQASDCCIVIASRSQPSFNLSRLRVSGGLREIGPDDLRFRSWEVERLFRDVYGEPLAPEDLTLLTQRTGGWVAALQLFHLATRGKHTLQRRHILSTLSKRSALMREYLARNVIEELPPELRDFMIQTSLLGRLTGPLCDRLLSRTGSAQILEELRRRRLFTDPIDNDEEYRYHEVLRSHLEAVLVEQFGEARARARYRRAGGLLEAVGALPEALRAFCRADDREAISSLLGREGEQLIDGSASWIDVMPPALSRHDPWLALAKARHHRAAGRFRAAVLAYQEAEHAFGVSGVSDVCRNERVALSAWLDPKAQTPSRWIGLLRQATRAEPIAARLAARDLAAPQSALAGGLAALLAGRLSEAIPLLTAAAEDGEASPANGISARIACAIARLLSGDQAGAEDAESAADDAERMDLIWLARMGRAALVLSDRPDGRSESTVARLACEYNDDEWGVALTSLMQGWEALSAGRDATGDLERAANGFRSVGAEVLETWARAALSLGLARAGDAAAAEMAAQAEVAARSLGVPGASAVAYAALSETGTPRAHEYRSLAAALQAECSLSLPKRLVPEVSERRRSGREPEIAIRCFGGFVLRARGTRVELAAVKPRARQLLRLLAVRAGRPVHREVLAEALWPEADPQASMRYVQVAVSQLRHSLEPHVGGGASSLIVRDGEAYFIAVSDDASVDLVDFDRALARAQTAHARQDFDRSLAEYQDAVRLHRGELLPEDGPADWVVRERDRYSAEACEAARAVAEMLLERDDPDGAARACERGLAIDRYRDDLWRLRTTAHERAGHVAAALHVRGEYEAVLKELGLPIR